MNKKYKIILDILLTISVVIWMAFFGLVVPNMNAVLFFTILLSLFVIYVVALNLVNKNINKVIE